MKFVPLVSCKVLLHPYWTKDAISISVEIVIKWWFWSQSNHQKCCQIQVQIWKWNISPFTCCFHVWFRHLTPLDIPNFSNSGSCWKYFPFGPNGPTPISIRKSNKFLLSPLFSCKEISEFTLLKKISVGTLELLPQLHSILPQLQSHQKCHHFFHPLLPKIAAL